MTGVRGTGAFNVMQSAKTIICRGILGQEKIKMFPPRYYQVEQGDAVYANYVAGIRQQLVVSATGTGKTRTFSAMPERLRSVLPGRMMVLAHREELIDQAIAKMVEQNPTLHVTKEMGGNVGDVNADVIVGSVATLGRENSTRAERFPWDSIDKVVVDEAHHATSESYTRIFTLADVLRSDTHKLLTGYTASSQRADGKALAEVFRKIVHEYSLRRAIEDGFLVEPRGYRVKTDTSLEGVKSTGGDYNQQQLADAVNNPRRNQLIVHAWLNLSQRKKTLGFTASVQHAKDLAETFRHYGVKAEAVWGEDPQRAWKIARHQGHDAIIAYCIEQGIPVPSYEDRLHLMFPVLLNCALLVEGYDDPSIECVLLARPTRSGVAYSQMVGRGTRLFLGKDFFIVIDVVDSTTRNSLLTLPTLMGLSTTLDLQGRGVWETVKVLEEAAKDYPALDFSQLADINSLQTFIEDVNLFEVKFPQEVEVNSDLTWYTNPTGGYVLQLPKTEAQVLTERYLPKEKKTPADSVTIAQNLLDRYEIRGKINGRKYKAERGSIEEAFQAADGLIDREAPDALKLIQRKAAWHDAPATAPQLKKIRRLYKDRIIRGMLIPPDLDKGSASRLISQAMIGR